MGIEISKTTAQERISRMLIGSSIDRMTYYITGWELQLVSADSPEYIIIASEITLPNIDRWRGSVAELPLDLTDTNEPEDTIVAISIFTVLNKWPVSSIEIDGKGNLMVGFENGIVLCVSAVVEIVDRAWHVLEGKEVLLTCEFGAIYESV